MSRRRQIVLATCCLSVFITGIDVTIVNVALPSIGRSWHAPVSGLQWVIDAYTLCIACLPMLSGSLADRFGRRRVFQIGLGTFTMGSLLCSVAPTLGALVAFRTLQGVGGSMLNPVAMSIIASTFTKPADRARAIGVWGSVGGLSVASGPVLGGVLVSEIGWRSIFWINVPIGLLAIALTHMFIPEFRALHARRLDFIGQVLVILIIGPLTAAVIEGPREGWASLVVIAMFAMVSVATVTLVLVEPQRYEPLVDLRFFRSASFSSAALINVVALMTAGGFLFLNTLYLQNVRGYSALRAGMLSAPMALALAVASVVSGRIVARSGPRLAVVLAGSLITVGTGLLIDVGSHTPVWSLIIAYVIFGAGSGLVGAPIGSAVLSGMPRDQAGVASAIASTCRQTGAALGVAICGSIVATSSGFATASHAAWEVLTGCGIATLALGLISTGRWAQVSAARNGERFAAEARGMSSVSHMGPP